MKISKSWKKSLITTLVLGFSGSLSLSQVNSEPINFLKKEILFLKWGTSDNEVGLLKKELTSSEGGGTNYFYPTDFGIDSEENLYILDTPNRKIKVFSKDGDFIKSFDNESSNTNMVVGRDGEVYLPIYGDGFKKHWVLRIKKNGERVKYVGQWERNFEGNTMYSWDGKPLTTFEDKKNKDLFNEPPHLYREKDITQDTLNKKKIYIKSEKINKFLNSSHAPDLELPIVQKKNMWTHGPEIIGVDKNGNIYIRYKFEWARALVEEDLYVYSAQGNPIGNIQIYNKPAIKERFRINFVKVSDEGNVYEMLILEDGAHILKWTKNKNEVKFLEGVFV